MKKIAIGCIALVAILTLVWVGAAGAAGFPNKRITYNICFNPGGESDITARFQEQALKKIARRGYRHQLQDRRRRGLCWAELVQTKPDGYLDRRSQPAPYRPPAPGDGQCRVQDPGPQANLHVREHPESPSRPERQPLQDPQGLIEAAKKNPPASLRSGAAAAPRRRTIWGPRCSTRPPGIQLTLYSLRRNRFGHPRPPGRSCDGADDLLHHGAQHKGRFRALAIASDKRMEVLPNVPTFKEQGYDIVEGGLPGCRRPSGNAG